MTLKKLRCFIATAQYGSFTQAGKALYMSQSAVSQQVSSLEKLVKTPLIVRKDRAIELTPNGKYLLERARPLVSDLEALLTEVSSLREEPPQRILRVMYKGTPDDPFVAPLLAAFRQHNPQVEVKLERFARGVNKMAKLFSGEEDVAFGRIPRGSGSEMTFVPMFRSCLYCIMLPEHPFAQLKSICREDLLDQKLVLLSDIDPVAVITTPHGAQRRQQEHNEILSAHHDKNKLLLTPDTQTAATLVKAGYGISVLDSSLLPSVEGLACVPYEDAQEQEYGFYFSATAENPVIELLAAEARAMYEGVPRLAPGGKLLQ